MRVEPYGVGSVLHIIKRGARGMEIVRDQSDHWRFVRNLYILNDHHQPRERHFIHKSDLWKGVGGGSKVFERPKEWPRYKPLVAILAWVLMPNHFHLLLQEIEEGGISKFMQRFCGSMTLAFNEKYKEKGSLFQGAYKSRTVDTDEYLQYVHAYVVVKNTFENYPGGLKKAIKEFDKAWIWAGKEYPFSSFLTSAKGAPSPIINARAFQDLGLARPDFKRLAKGALAIHIDTHGDLHALHLEDW